MRPTDAVYRPLSPQLGVSPSHAKPRVDRLQVVESRIVNPLSCRRVNRARDAVGIVAIGCQPLTLNHDTLVANVNEHLELLDHLVLLPQLLLKLFDLFLAGLAELVQVLSGLGELASEISTDALLGRGVWLAVDSSPVLG